MTSALEAESLRRFDELVEQGQIIFQDTEPILVKSRPFNFQFRIADSLTKKPQIDIDVARKLQEKQAREERRGSSTADIEAEKQRAKEAELEARVTAEANSESRAEDNPKSKEGKPKSPFDRDPPSFVLARPTRTHTLRFNKFCVVRPQFVVHTNEWESQIEPLNEVDLEAGWKALRELGEGYMLIFNGGTQGGWSLPHRHMQLLPLSRGEEYEYELWPDEYAGEQTEKDGIIMVPEIPYAHALIRLPADLSTVTPASLHATYASLLRASDVSMERNEYSHNLLVTHRWMLVIPRSRAAQPGINVINAAAMVGMVWIPSQEVWRAWQGYGDLIGTMARFGFENKRGEGEREGEEGKGGNELHL